MGATAAATRSVGLQSSSPISARESIHCPHSDCGLNQFIPNDRKCRRCHRDLIPPTEPAPEVSSTAAYSHPVNQQVLFNFDLSLPFVLWWLRDRQGLSQKQLAKHMGVPRTYISKVENGLATPTLKNFARIAKALGEDEARIIRMCEVLENGE